MVDVVRREAPVTPKTVEEAVALLVGRLSDEDRSLLRSLPADELTWRLHFTLGMAIRNNFGLWGGSVDLLRSCGSDTMSADDASSVIIRVLRERLRDGR
jgi:hypothetical protein